MSQKIAIIGGGIAGLTAAYLLQQKYDITVFEKSERIGGNAYTLDLPDGQSVDIAVAAYGKRSYRNLFSLFRRLDIETARAACLGVSFYNLQNSQGIFLTPSIKGLAAQRLDILRPDRLRSFVRLVLGLKKAGLLSKRGELAGLTVEQALHKLPALEGDAKLIFLTVLCLISSMSCEEVLDAPAAFFIEKILTYGDLMPPRALLSVHLTKKRTKHYVQALSARFHDALALNAKIRTVVRRESGVSIGMETGGEVQFHKVVFACNADQALQLLEEPTAEERRLLGAWRYTEGRVVVHRDHARFPKKELMEGYIFLYQPSGRYIDTSVSGTLWALPGVPKECDLISTQHPNFPIRKDLIVFEKVFRTPRFDFQSCATIAELPSLNGVRNTYYCGSHFGFGLHEDAVTSAINVARSLGVPF